MRKLLLTLLAALACTALAQDFEVGYQYDARGFTPFIYVTEDYYLGELASIDTQLWFSPSVEVVFGRGSWLQAQLILDAPIASLSLRARYATDGSFVARAGVLFELGD